MSLKFVVTVGLVVGSAIGSYIPLLWGDNSFLSVSSLMFSLVGGLAGVFVGVWFFQNYLG